MNTFKHIVILLLLTGCTNIAVIGREHDVVFRPEANTGSDKTVNEAGTGGDFAVKVEVKIYKHIESGNLIYCRTGNLDNSALHEYQGEGKIDESKAEHC